MSRPMARNTADGAMRAGTVGVTGLPEAPSDAIGNDLTASRR